MSDVLSERRGAVELLRLNRPERRNAIGGALLGELLRAAEAADADPAVRALVTTGEGGTYCVGADSVELRALAQAGEIDLDVLGVDGIGGDKGLEPLAAAEDRLGIGRWTLRFLGLGLPTVAAINGGAGGGGLALALLHDVRIAVRGAKLAFAWSSIGLGPEMGVSWLLPRIVGSVAAFDLLTRPGSVEAEEALELGLVSEVVAASELTDAAVARAEALGRISPEAFVATKRLLQAAPGTPLEAQLEAEWWTQRQLFKSGPVLDFLRGLRG